MENNIKFFELKGALPGKKVVLLAGVHGNEVCGVRAFDEFIPQLKIDSGSALFIFANLEAIKQNKRFVEYNLNRCFLKEQPPAIQSALEGRIAREIAPYLESADALLDIHASPIPESPPFAICDEKWIKDCSMFDVDIASFNWDPFEPGSTDYYMNLQKKPGFCVECGCLNDEKSIKIAKSAIERFLIWTGNLSGKIAIKENQKVVKITGLYKNKFAHFRKSREFKDFEQLKEKTLIGKEGLREIYGEQGQIVLFVRDCDSLNEECFLTAQDCIL